ncbi:MAG: radical SAM/SPASM domain-containing protein [Bacillota bacterium]
MFGLKSLFRQWRELRGPGAMPRRPLKAVQVEVTTRCNFSCKMCPGCSGEAVQRDMEWSTYLNLAEDFAMAELVYLQGWGEPLLHPKILDMVGLAKSKGCQVGFTTNGSFLHRELISRLVEKGIDFVTVSFAGATAATHEGIRKGSKYDGLVANVNRLVELRQLAGLNRPKITFSYLMMEANLPELSQAVELAHRLGCDEMVATNLDFPANAAQEKNRIFDWGPAPPDRLAEVKSAVARAKALGLNLRVYPLELEEEVLVCELDPVRQLFVSVDGDIAPCVYASIAGRQEVLRFFRGQERLVARTVFGNVNQDRLKAIWETESYLNFRGIFKQRLALYSQMMGEAVARRDLRQLERSWEGLFSGCPLPPGCDCCYKAYNA